MAADRYDADSENGDHVADPSAEALLALLAALDREHNTFVTLTPAAGCDWYASVSLLADGTYEVERRDPARPEPRLTTATDLPALVRELTDWLADRVGPGSRT